MRTIPLIVIAVMFSASFAEASERTFKDILGEEKVRMVVRTAANEATEQKEDRSPRTRVEPSLYERVVVLAGETKVRTADLQLPMRAAARLKQGVVAFFEDYRAFLVEQGSEIGPLRLGVRHLNDFIEWFKSAKGCGKIPCDIPPCCGDCDGCKQTRNELHPSGMPCRIEGSLFFVSLNRRRNSSPAGHRMAQRACTFLNLLCLPGSEQETKLGFE